MTTSSALLDIATGIVLLGALIYWVFIAPRRALRQRRQQLPAQSSAPQQWDPNTYSGRRNR